MTGRTVMSGAVLVVVAGAFAATGAFEPAGVARTATPAPPRGVVEDCSTRSMARFPRAFEDRRNVVVGPLVMVGARSTTAETVREFGGNKFPVLVRAGHRVTLALSPATRRVASLAYGPLPEGVELAVRDGHRVVTFAACGRGKRSGSSAGRVPVTFWSGFVLTRSPRCVPLEVWVDDEPAPRRRALPMGARCP